MNTLRIFSLSMLIILTACGEEKNVKMPGFQEEVIEYASIYENPKFTETYNLYVTYFNKVIGSYDVSEQYYSRAFPGEYPAAVTGSPSLVTISDYPDSYLEDALNAEVKIPELAEAGKKVREQLLPLRTAMNQAEGYYERGEFEDDGAAQGRVYHEQITTGLANLNEAVANMQSSIAVVDNKLRTIENENNKKNGYYVRYHTARVIDLARQAYELVQVETMEEVAALDPKNIDALRQQLTDEIKVMDSYASDPEQFNLEFSVTSPASGYYSQYLSQSNRMVKNLRALSKMVQDQDFTKGGRMVISNVSSDGMPASIADNYSRLIELYNDMRD